MSLAKLKAFPVPEAGQSFTAEAVEGVTALLNAGEISIRDVSSHFSVDPNIIIQSLTGRDPSGFTEKTGSMEDADAMNKLVSAGVANIQDVANFYSVPPQYVEDIFTVGYNYTQGQMINARNGVNINSPEGIAEAGATASSGADLTTQFETPTADPDPQTGLSGSEEALTSGVAAAINALNASNTQNSQMLSDQYDKGLVTATAQNTLAQNQITDSTKLGLEGLDSAQLSAQGRLQAGYDSGVLDANTQSDVARKDIKDSTSAGVEAAQAANVAAAGNLNDSYAKGLLAAQARATSARNSIGIANVFANDAIKKANVAARGDLSKGTQDGLAAALAQSNVARDDINTNADLGMGYLNQGVDQARQDISGSFDRAEAMYNPYREAGANALGMQQALSGALGQEAFNQAYNESPQMAFLREQGMRANLAGAGATGGLGGGNVQKELQRFGQGLASQGLQQQINNLGMLSGQGLSATGSAAGTATAGGSNLANLAATRGQAGQQSYENRGSNLSNIASNLGNQQLNANTNLGANLANNSMSTGQSLSQSINNRGINLANIESALGTQELNTNTGLGANLANMNISAGQTEMQALANAGINRANIASNLGGNLLNANTNLSNNQANIDITGGQNRMAGITNAGMNRANLASALGGQALGVSSGLGNALFQNNANGANLVSNLNNNLGVNLATGRTNAGNNIATGETNTANNIATSYENEATNTRNIINAQRNMLIEMVDGGFIDEAAAQTRFGEMLAQSEMSRGNAQAGVPFTPFVNPNYAQGIGNALDSAALGSKLAGGGDNQGGQNYSPVQVPSFRDIFN